MKNLVLVLLMIMVVNGTAQTYFSKIYAPLAYRNLQVDGLSAKDDKVFISFESLCNDSTVCYNYMSIDTDGNQIGLDADPRFKAGNTTILEGEDLYVSGKSNLHNDKMSLLKRNVVTSETEYIELSFNQDRYPIVTNTSLVSFNDHIIVFGSVYDTEDQTNDGDAKGKGAMFWIDKRNFSLDTMMIVEPFNEVLRIDDAIAGEENLYLSVMFDDFTEIGGQSFKKFYKGIIKFNMSKEKEWDWRIIENPTGLTDINILQNGNVIISVKEPETVTTSAIYCVNPLGEEVWHYYFDNNGERVTSTFAMTIAKNGDIIGCGRARSLVYNYGIAFSYFGEKRGSGMLYRLSPQGELIWERVFPINRGGDPFLPEEFKNFPKYSYFRDVVELDNNDIVVGGVIYNINENPNSIYPYGKDLWIVKANSTGCLVDGCGLEQWIQEGEVKMDTCKFLQANPEWYYSPYSSDCIEELHEVKIIGDTVIGNRFCSILGVYEEGAFQIGSKLIVFYELDHVFFYEDEQFKTIYDFSYNIVPGDTVSYFLPQNIGYYDISSSSDIYVPSKDPYRYFVWDVSFDKLSTDDDSLTVSEIKWLRKFRTWTIEGDSICHDMGDIIAGFNSGALSGIGKVIGVGSEKGFMGSRCVADNTGCNEFFRCFKSEDFEYSEVGGECKPSEKIWIAHYGAKWEYCLKQEPDAPYTLDIICEVIDTYNLNGMRYATIEGRFINITDSKIDTVQIINDYNQVYYSFGDSLHLLYDFEVLPKDTLILRFPIEIDLDWFENHPETSSYFKLIVDSIGFVFIDEEYLKRIYFTTIFGVNDNGNHIWAPTELGSYYTEKLGYENFILPYLVPGYLDINANCDLNQFTDEDIQYINEGAYCMPLSTIENPFNNMIDLYPSPTTGIIRFDEIWLGEISSINVYDCFGRKNYYTQQIINNEIDMSNKPSGIYFIRIKLKNGKNYTKKIVKM